MRRLFTLVAVTTLLFQTINSQTAKVYPEIDSLIIFGEYEKAIDTCRSILLYDSLNAGIWYKMGIAQQNMQPDTGSFNSFLNSMKLEPGNNLYKYTVAKGYTNRNKNFRAKPLLTELLLSDSLNWNYASSLTGILLEEGKYDEAIKIYQRFYKLDSANFVILDKLGFANLRKGNFEAAIDYYNKSMAVNDKNIDAIRNLSFLYPNVNKIDTAIVLLDKAIQMDPEDSDLYARRAVIFWSKHYWKRALNDYLTVLSLGDSSVLYLKRAGLCYVNNLNSKEALPYLLKAHARDTADFETINYIANSYYRLFDLKKSQLYYSKVIELLKDFPSQLSYTYTMLGETYKADGMYKDAIENYLEGQKLNPNVSVSMMIANIYDERLNDMPNAIIFYRKFLSEYKSGLVSYPEEYIGNIRKRLSWLEEKQAEQKKTGSAAPTTPQK